MQACLILLTLAVSPSTTQQQTQTVHQRLDVIGDWLEQWKTLSLETLQLLLEFQVNEADLAVALRGVVDKVIQNVTSQLLLQCNSTQLLIDLQILKGRQAVSGAVQGGQVFMFVAYLVTIAVLCLVKHCNKHRERLAQSEFELLEAKLQSNKAKRRAAAARAKSAQEGLPRPART